LAKQKRFSAKTWLIISLTLTTMVVMISFFNRYLRKPRFIRYTGFGIDVPVNYSIHGIDVSHHQSSIDWQGVKDMQIKNIKIGFCFIKATEGVDCIDAGYCKNWQESKENNIPRGAYHFFNPCLSGRAQAENFIQTVQLEKGDLPPVLDVEHLDTAGVANLQNGVAEWIKTVEDFYKVKPIIYSNADFYATCLSPKFDDYPLWVAHYMVKDKPRVKRNWVFWQHNESGHVNGVKAFVDFNVFNGDSTQFNDLLIK